MNKEISALEYGDTSGKLINVTGRLAVQESFGWRTAVYIKERWSGLDKKALKDKLFEEQKNLLQCEDKNREIDECVRELKRCMAAILAEKREAVYPYLIAADGMRIFNSIGAVIIDFIQGKVDRDRNNMLAGKLETWYYHYRRLWQTLSKESELYRVSDVIFWYADYLRTMA